MQMVFIKLTLTDGTPAYINIKMIESIVQPIDADHTWVHCVASCEDKGYAVKETPEDIFNKLHKVGVWQ